MGGAPMAPPHKLSPPYPPTTAGLGGAPNNSVDTPICAVFLVLFMLGAVGHMTILQVNLKRGHKFVISGLQFGFCMSRIAATIMRIVWANRLTNAKIAIAANVFVAAGVILLFLINMIFAQRIIRAMHPNLGWHPAFHHAFTALYVLIVLTLFTLIISVIQSFYSLNDNTKRIDRDILLYGQTFYSVISFLPIPMVLAALVLPRTTRTEKFGHGRFRTKIAILMFTSFLLCLGASFRAGVNYAGGERPATDPAPYQSKACFYIFQFTVEIIVIYLYIIIRVDKRFYVPDKSKKPGDYSRGPDFYTRQDMAAKAKGSGEGGIGSFISPEEEVFDDMHPDDIGRKDDVERGTAAKESGGKEPAKDIPLGSMHRSTPSQNSGYSARVSLTPMEPRSPGRV